MNKSRLLMNKSLLWMNKSLLWMRPSKLKNWRSKRRRKNNESQKIERLERSKGKKNYLILFSFHQ